MSIDTIVGIIMLSFFFIAIDVSLKLLIGVESDKGYYYGEIKTQNEFGYRILMWLIPMSYFLILLINSIKFLKKVSKLPPK